MKTQTIKTGLKGALVIGGLCALIPSVYGQGIGLKKFDEMLTKTDAKLKRGKVVYQRQCASCHGATGQNDTDYAKNLPGMAQGGFAAGNYNRGGGLIQIYNLISKPTPGVKHSVISGFVRYQDRWAVSHYVQSLSTKRAATDPADVVKGAKFEAINGYCRESFKKSIASKVTPKGKAQLTQAAKLYKDNCASCHGTDGKGDGKGGNGLVPPPRNFKSGSQKWTNGTSTLAIFNTLANGIENTSMRDYKTLSEDERWALVHYVRQWVPAGKKEKVTDDQLLAVCRTLSTPPPPEPISVELAMKFLVEDAPKKKALKQNYGPIYKYPNTDVIKGQDTYTMNCASCHGAQGKGMASSKPYGSFPPYLYLKVDRLQPSTAGGTYEQFARRSIGGVHATLPNMTGAALLNTQDWKNLQSYVAQFEGKKEFVPLVKPKKTKVILTATKIEITERVFFDEAKASIQEQSFELLDEVAKVLIANDTIKLIQIEGHTDNQGGPSVNIALSGNRAKSVREYLIKKGVPATRILAKGFGSTKPIAPNTTPEGKAKNRRVEFVIVKQDAKVVATPPTVPKNP